MDNYIRIQNFISMKTRYINLSFYFQLNEQSNNHDVYKYHKSFKYFFHLLPKMKA